MVRVSVVEVDARIIGAGSTAIVDIGSGLRVPDLVVSVSLLLGSGVCQPFHGLLVAAVVSVAIDTPTLAITSLIHLGPRRLRLRRGTIVVVTVTSRSVLH